MWKLALFLLFSLVACSSPSEMQAPLCRAASQACALTSDCCANLICQSDTCQTPPNCGDGVCDEGETMASCCTDCGCPSGQSCQSNVCTTAAVCGDGACQPSENQSTCCIDCGCPAGQACNGEVCLPDADTSAVTWDFSDQCNARVIFIKVFDTTLGATWPSKQEAWGLTPGASRQEVVHCNLADTICWGARDPATGDLWGVGDMNTQSCASCCWNCTRPGTITVPPLTCP